MLEPARLGNNLIAAKVAIIPSDGAVDDCGLGASFLLMVPNFHVLARLEGEGPGVVPLEGLITHLGMPGPEPVHLFLCYGLWWCWQRSSDRPDPQPHGW